MFKEKNYSSCYLLLARRCHDTGLLPGMGNIIFNYKLFAQKSFTCFSTLSLINKITGYIYILTEHLSGCHFVAASSHVKQPTVISVKLYSMVLSVITRVIFQLTRMLRR